MTPSARIRRGRRHESIPAAADGLEITRRREVVAEDLPTSRTQPFTNGALP
jgi:hypothetical protein